MQSCLCGMMLAEVVFVKSAPRLASASWGAVHLVLYIDAGGMVVLFRGYVVPATWWFPACITKAWLLLNNCNMNVQNSIWVLLLSVCSDELLF